MAIKKSELYSSLWAGCDELRDGMDPSQYKDYILVLLFVKYVSDKYAGDADAIIEIPEGGSFKDMQALKGNKDIGNQINIIIGVLAGGDDILGDAFEYLMKNFATVSGKSKGQFYTPSEVSRVMAKVLNIHDATNKTTFYDPTCGSGSLLLKSLDEADGSTALSRGTEDGFFADLDKVNKANVQKRLKELLASIERSVKTEMERISQRLTQRIKELAERYEMPLPRQTIEVTEFEEKVNAHLQKMGFVWS